MLLVYEDNIKCTYKNQVAQILFNENPKENEVREKKLMSGRMGIKGYQKRVTKFWTSLTNTSTTGITNKNLRKKGITNFFTLPCREEQETIKIEIRKC